MNGAMGNMLGSMGRRGDTIVAHISPFEAAVLKALGGKGGVNPNTGLLEFYDDSDSDRGGTGGVGAEGPTGMGGGFGDYGGGFDIGEGIAQAAQAEAAAAAANAGAFGGPMGTVAGETMADPTGVYGNVFNAGKAVTEFSKNMDILGMMGKGALYGTSVAGFPAGTAIGGILGLGYDMYSDDRYSFGPPEMTEPGVEWGGGGGYEAPVTLAGEQTLSPVVQGVLGRSILDKKREMFSPGQRSATGMTGGIYA